MLDKMLRLDLPTNHLLQLKRLVLWMLVIKIWMSQNDIDWFFTASRPCSPPFHYLLQDYWIKLLFWSLHTKNFKICYECSIMKNFCDKNSRSKKRDHSPKTYKYFFELFLLSFNVEAFWFCCSLYLDLSCNFNKDIFFFIISFHRCSFKLQKISNDTFRFQTSMFWLFSFILAKSFAKRPVYIVFDLTVNWQCCMPTCVRAQLVEIQIQIGTGKTWFYENIDPASKWLNKMKFSSANFEFDVNSALTKWF